MYDVMDGVRVVEVAEYTFVPSAAMPVRLPDGRRTGFGKRAKMVRALRATR